ncbi:MAG: tetratricopeptide repeat protein [Phycisphaerales bacterium]|nr:MAG: tetratricopeptide repeat protein [Phycisphaerales bacterium]
MAERRTQSLTAAIALVLVVSSICSAETWRLEKTDGWKSVSDGDRDRYLLAVSKTKELVSTGQAKAAKKAFDELKTDFPDIAGPDLDIFIEAEIHFCKGNYVRAVRSYDKLLTDYPRSELREAALDREFTIAQAYLAGRKKTVLGFIRLKGYAEGIKIMEKISDRTGLADPNGIGLKAALAVAKSYQQRKKFEEAHLKWSEISSQWQTGQIGKDALLSMARCKHGIYNKQPEHRRHLYDVSCLSSAKSYYERFQLLYPSDAKELRVAEILKEIDEQFAYKQLAIGRYYKRTGNVQAANLYFDMVIQNWPNSEAAGMARAVPSKD